MKKGMRIFILFLLSLCIYGQTLQTMPVYAATGKKTASTTISKKKKNKKKKSLMPFDFNAYFISLPKL